MVFPLGDDNTDRATTPFVVYGLIALNALMWFLQLSSGDSFTSGWAAIPYEITHNEDLVRPTPVEIGDRSVAIPQYPGPVPIQLTLLSAMFMHGSWMHIIGNMLYLWIFGDQIEDLLGHVKFVVFYLICGLAASVAQIALDPSSPIPTLGASGAIAGVLGAYLVKHPSKPVHVLMFRFITTLPAWIVLGGWIALQIFSQVSVYGAGQSTGVAYMAHIGGFVAGVVLILILGSRRKATAVGNRWG
jgi:membrane associated rhomboid family serine protease